MCGIIKGVVDIVTSPIDSAVKLAKGDIAGAFLEPFEAAFDADLFFGADFGDMMSLMDDVLDEVPGLKEAIVIAAGVATGGVGAIVAAAAIAATDTLSEVNEGNFELNDLAAGGLEFASLAAAGATAGAAGALTTTAKTQIASRVLASSGLLGEDASRFVQIAGGAVGGDWSSVTESIRNSAIALQQTGLLGEDVNNVLGAVAAASTGDYTSLQSGVTAGIGAAQKVAGDEASPFLAGLSTAINGDYGSAETIASTLIETTDRTGLLGSDSPYLEAGRVALGSDWSSAGSAGESLLQVADASDVIPGAGGRLLDAGQVALDSNWESVDGAIGAAVDVVDETDVLGAGVGQVIEVADDAVRNENYRDLVGL